MNKKFQGSDNPYGKYHARNTLVRKHINNL